jgi:mannose-6-phosphate isomerase-like protein (cupin superfamily)
MVDTKNTHITDTPKEPHPKLKELAERLTGKWRVGGPEINGQAEYRSVKGGLLLVSDVDFVVGGTKMKVLQHIAYDLDTDTLRARYMDTMGDESTYIWALDGQKMRVSRGDKNSAEYFEATFSDDDSSYSGTWHYPDGADDDAATERIEYKRIGYAAVPFTLRNLKEDLEDLGSNFDGAPDLEFRAATKALGLEKSGLTYQRIPLDYRFPYGHTHKVQEEVYVVVRGSGRMKLDDEIVELKEWDAVRVPPGTWRGYEAGPEGLELLVIGAPNLGEDPRGDVDGQRDWWAD